jgi:hypothetical protein
MVQNMNNTVNALVVAETMFTQKATLLTSPIDSNEKTRPIIKNKGAPGG